MIHFKANNTEYPASIAGKITDRDWGGRDRGAGPGMGQRRLLRRRSHHRQPRRHHHGEDGQKNGQRSAGGTGGGI